LTAKLVDRIGARKVFDYTLAQLVVHFMADPVTSTRMRPRNRTFPERGRASGVGPAGDHVRRLDDRARAGLRDRCRRLLPFEGPIDITASAWTVLGRPS
jgi:hypothetical protein